MENLISDIDILKSEERSCEVARISPETNSGQSRKLYIESYGCQMNFSDSEIVASILKKEGFDTTSDVYRADVILLNTCSIREKAEKTVSSRLSFLNSIKKNNSVLLLCVIV